jgi:hypothetical protein
MPKTSLPKRLVHSTTLQRLFHELGFEGASAVIGKPFNSSIVAPGHHQATGTKSEMVPIRAGSDMAVCHRYLNPDGTLGASGRHDPKMIRHGGVEYICHSIKCPCAVCKAPPEDWKQFV